MRGFGQIDELARIAEPDVGVITNIGPVHLELVGSTRGRRAREGRAARARAGRGRSPPTCRSSSRTCATDLDVVRVRHRRDARGLRPAARDDPRARAAGRARGAVHVASPAREPAGGGRGGAGRRRRAVRRASTCSSARCAASASSCRRASSSSTTATTPTRCPCAPRSTISPRRRLGGRRVAVLGDMLELGRGRGCEAHREIGAYAAASGVDVLVAVGPLSARDARGLRRRVASSVADAARGRRARRARSSAPGDVVLVKASRGIGLETVAEALARG